MLERERVLGRPIALGDLTLTPESELISLALPYWRGWWHRPTAVVVQRKDKSERIAVVDVTRQVQLATWTVMGLLSFTSLIAAGMMRRKR